MNSDTQTLLNEKLEALKQKVGNRQNLHVVWFPNKKPISGEIKNNVIFVYDEDRTIAVETLYHEFIEHLIANSIEPYKQLANKFMEMFNENAYSIKEETIDGITKLISEYKTNRPDKILSKR